MRKLLVFQHSAREPLGLLDPLLRRHGFRIRYVNFSRQPELRPEYRAEAEASGPQHQLAHILRDTHGHAPQAGALSERVFGEFLGLFGFRKKLRLGSL